MKRTYMTVLVAVFLSVVMAGCYTKLKGPEPGTGVYQYDDQYPYYNNDYYNPLYFNYGWYSPYSFGFPSYYGNFYTPWWYDPYYYYDGGGYYHGDGNGTPSGKDIRRRRGGEPGTMPSVPGSTYSPPPATPSGPSDQGYTPPSNPPSSGSQGSSGGTEKSSGEKSTRGRR